MDRHLVRGNAAEPDHGASDWRKGAVCRSGVSVAGLGHPGIGLASAEDRIHAPQHQRLDESGGDDALEKPWEAFPDGRVLLPSQWKDLPITPGCLRSPMSNWSM